MRHDEVVAAILDLVGVDAVVSGGDHGPDVFGPVLAALRPVSLDGLCGHDDDQHLLLPDHLPEVREGLRQRALRKDEGSRLLVAVDEVGVDVVGAGLVVVLKKANELVAQQVLTATTASDKRGRGHI